MDERFSLLNLPPILHWIVRDTSQLPTRFRTYCSGSWLRFAGLPSYYLGAWPVAPYTIAYIISARGTERFS